VLADERTLPSPPLLTPLRTERLRALRGLARREWLVILLLAVWATFIFFWRLDDPGKYIYDEVYHAFTGNLMVQNDPAVYEWWQSTSTLQDHIEGTQYEWTHPPLGKLIIAGSIWLLGNNSLGWRFTNALFGVVCVLLMYALARVLFRDRLLATLAAALMSVEGLMFAESRIGTNDIFQLAFLMAAFVCFGIFLLRTPWRGMGWLFATGAFLGLALGTKWPAMYSIILLAAVPFIRGVWPQRQTAASEPPALEIAPEAPPAQAHWSIPSRIAYLASTAVAIIIIPAGLYIASYIQMFLQKHTIAPGYDQIGPISFGSITLGPSTLPDSGWWSMFVGEQWQMWHYHTTLTAGHPYYSKWWEWLLDVRPVFYYVDRSEGYVANTYNLGNPLLYWAFPIAIVLSCWLVWKKRDPRLALVLGAFAINWLPWALSPRGMFFYHFLPAVPFLVLLVAYCLTWLWRRPEPKWQRVAGIYVAVVFFSFAFFYTQLAAWPVPEWYAAIHYWLPTWQ
jgi:dolichyl-phosphate-mannose--protein O-mannosyl transferase